MSTPRTRTGFSLLELVITIAIIGLLLALVIPAVQQSRSAARRGTCLSHLRQLGIAIHSYHATHRYFPPGNTNAHSMFVGLLPYLDQQPLYNQVDFSSPSSAANAHIRNIQIPVLLCPADAFTLADHPAKPNNYVGNAGTGVQAEGRYNGFFQPLRLHRSRGGGPLAARNFSDGLSQTVAFSEVLIGGGSGEPLRTIWKVPVSMRDANQLDAFADACAGIDYWNQIGDPWGRGGGWMYGDMGPTLYNHLQTPNQLSCTNNTWVPGGAYPPVSLHPGGVNVCFGDGACRFVSESIDRRLWRALGTRSSGDSTSGF